MFYPLCILTTTVALYLVDVISPVLGMTIGLFTVLVYLGVFDIVPPFHRTICPAFSAVMVFRRGSFAQLPDAFASVARHCPKKADGVGIYFDNPDEVKDPAWAAGFVVPAAEARAYAEAAHAAGVKGVQLYTVPNSAAFQTVVPWRHALTPMLQAGKVYRNLEAQVGKLTAPCLEFYDTDLSDQVLTMRTVYLLQNQDDITTCFDFDAAVAASKRR
jgi:hypothetical protein